MHGPTKVKLESNCYLLWQQYLTHKFNSMGWNSEDFIVECDGTCSNNEHLTLNLLAPTTVGARVNP